jgi:hypothetical protein
LALLEPSPAEDVDGCGSVALTSLLSTAASVSSFSMSSDATLSFSAPSALLSSVKRAVYGNFKISFNCQLYH